MSKKCLRDGEMNFFREEEQLPPTLLIEVPDSQFKEVVNILGISAGTQKFVNFFLPQSTKEFKQDNPLQSSPSVIAVMNSYDRNPAYFVDVEAKDNISGTVLYNLYQVLLEKQKAQQLAQLDSFSTEYCHVSPGRLSKKRAEDYDINYEVLTKVYTVLAKSCTHQQRIEILKELPSIEFGNFMSRLESIIFKQLPEDKLTGMIVVAQLCQLVSEEEGSGKNTVVIEKLREVHNFLEKEDGKITPSLLNSLYRQFSEKARLTIPEIVVPENIFYIGE